LDTPASFGLDVPDDAGFARYSPGCSLTLAPGLSSGPPGRSPGADFLPRRASAWMTPTTRASPATAPGASLRSEEPGRFAPVH